MPNHTKRSLADILARLPDLKRKGKQYEGPCPLCGGTNRFHVEEGAAVEILMGCRQCEAPFAEFMRELFPEDFERRNGGHRNPVKIPEERQPKPGKKPVEKTGPRIEGGKWAVHDYGGAYWATVTRLDFEGGGKEFRYSHEVQGETVWRLPPGERYLFNGVAAFKDTAAPLLVVEGEKAAARVAQWRADDASVPVAVSFIGGSQASNVAKHDLSIFTARDVTISADADAPGRKFGAAVEAALKPMAAVVRLSLPPGDDGRDAADFADWADARAWVKKYIHGERPALEFLDKLVPEPWEWIWPGWLPKDELILFAGPTEAGKGLTGAAVIAGLTRGRLPDGGRIQPQTVLMIQAEDHWEKTVAPRLIRHGADMGRVARLRAPESDEEASATPLQRLTAKRHTLPAIDLIWMDPITTDGVGATSGGEVVRPYLEAWVDFTRSLGASMVGVIHTGKGAKKRITEGTLTDLVAGSAQWIAVCRFALAIFPEPDSYERLLMILKTNADSVSKRNGFRIQAEMVEGERTIRIPFTIEHDVVESARAAIADRPTSDIREALLDAIEDFEPGERYDSKPIIRDVADDTGKSRQAVLKHVQRLVKENRIAPIGGGHGKSAQWYVPR